jgi:N-acetylneuraminic acid mutarotase
MEMPIERKGLAAVAYENHIYIFGGQSSSGVIAPSGKYSLITDDWDRLPDKPTPVSEVQGAVIGGKVYIPGGWTASGEAADVLEIYDPREGRWEVGARMPVALSAYTLVPFEGRLYIFGGWDGKRYRREVYAYDPGEDRWEEMTPMPTGRAYAGAGVAGDQIFVIGGEDESGPLPVSEIFTPALEGESEPPWMEGTELPEPRSGLGVASIADILYVIGGVGPDNEELNSLQYFSQQQIWQPFEAPTSGVWSHFGIVTSGPNLYVLGGRVDDQIVGSNLEYQAIFTISIPLVND